MPKIPYSTSSKTTRKRLKIGLNLSSPNLKISGMLKIKINNYGKNKSF